MKKTTIFYIFFSLSLTYITCVKIEVISPKKPFTFKTLILYANSTLQVDVTDVKNMYSYIEISVHSQKENITLSESMTISLVGNHVTGKDVGLIVLLENMQTSGTVWINNANKINVTVLLTIVLKKILDPIPGGCNLEFPVEISPFLRIIYNRMETLLEYQHANIGYERNQLPPSCSIAATELSYDIYVYFLDENDFNEESYFKALVKMTDLNSIYSNAKKISPFEISPKTRISFMSYPGQGVIYNIIVHYKKNITYEAAYIPAVTYGCNFSSKIDGCGHLTSTLAKIFMIIFAIFGFILCLFGHHMQNTATFFFGFLASALISFILITKYTNLETTSRDSITLSCGIVWGLLCILLWNCLHIHSPIKLMRNLVFGFLLAAIFYFTPLGDFQILRNDINYWLLFSCMMLLATIILLPYSKLSSILTTSVVGSYVFIVAIDRFIHTTLSYIVLNIIKRALYENLNFASNAFPFQEKDIILVSVWGGFALFGISFQYYISNRKPSLSITPYTVNDSYWIRQQFNPSSEYSRDSVDNEHRPLLYDSHRKYDSVNNQNVTVHNVF